MHDRYLIQLLSTPISTLAVDLLAAQFLVPPLISYIKPREFSKKVLSDWWRATSRHLRLTSFMFNGRYPEEEGTHVRRTLRAWLLWEQAPIPSGVYADVAISDQDEHAPVVFRRDGSLARVPKHDSVPVLDDRRMIVPVDPILLEPIDAEERRLGHPAASETGDEENNTTVVYLPPQFKLRITLFLFLMWLSGSTLTCSITIVPLLLGRHVFEVYLNAKVHDMYAFIAGAYIMVFLSILINWVGHKMEVLTRNGGALRMSEVVAGAKDKLTLVCVLQAISVISPLIRKKQASKLVYLAAVFGFIIPLLIGVAADLFVFMPIRLSKSSDALVIHMSEVRITQEGGGGGKGGLFTHRVSICIGLVLWRCLSRHFLWCCVCSAEQRHSTDPGWLYSERFGGEYMGPDAQVGSTGCLGSNRSNRYTRCAGPERNPFTELDGPCHASRTVPLRIPNRLLCGGPRRSFGAHYKARSRLAQGRAR